jgi:C-terminal processing protease CtpA/Prc
MKRIRENNSKISPKKASLPSHMRQIAQSTLLVLAAASTILISLPSTAIASEPSSDPLYHRTSRYWSSLNSNDKEQIQSANEKLIDHAVGTITTMFYDNSGGINFSPKDLYDRWKVLRVYAKGGAKSVDELVSYTSAKLVDSEGVSKGQSEANSKVPEFRPQLFVVERDTVKVQTNHYPTRRIVKEGLDDEGTLLMPPHAFDSRDDVVTSLKWLVSSLDDPYSKYLTREELQKELSVRDDGFLGLGAIVEPPSVRATHYESNAENRIIAANNRKVDTASKASKTKPSVGRSPSSSSSSLTSLTRVDNLPIVTAIAPDSPAERAGIVTGDRIAAVGSDNFIGLGREEVAKRIYEVYSGADNYLGHPDLMVAKPVVRSVYTTENDESDESLKESIGREKVVGYKLSRVRLPTVSVQPFHLYEPALASRSDKTSLVTDMVTIPPASAATPFVAGGDSIVHYELLTPNDSIFRRSPDEALNSKPSKSVGYIRLTRFSRSATSGYLNAVQELEKAGAESYIIDVRNNYGGVIQESMLTAATLLRDPHTVLCYTLNSRGGFTPHDAEEYIVDKRYPGYLMSTESRSVTFEQVKRDDPEFVDDSGSLKKWVPPSSYASLHEQRMKRGIHRGGLSAINPFGPNSDFSNQRRAAEELKQLKAQKKLVILMNGGTASAAEVFVSSLHDNGRTVATIGTKTYGKGLIQHTFPMPDGGGLRLTVAEYLTPALQHVTKVGNARYDKITGEFVGGGVQPDIFCSSTQGIPSNIGADICVGMGLDALEDADLKEAQYDIVTDSKDKSKTLSRMGGTKDGSGKRRIPTQGIVRVSLHYFQTYTIWTFNHH